MLACNVRLAATPLEVSRVTLMRGLLSVSTNLFNFFFGENYLKVILLKGRFLLEGLRYTPLKNTKTPLVF